MADHTDLRGARILLVDDMPANLDLLYALLEPEGYKLSMAPNGEVALRIATETEAVPDLILLDVMMPGMTGRQTLEKLRENPDFANVPAIFMTARAQPNELEELRGIGATEVISKPFDPMSLADQIKAAIA